jgi:hypothetical protein
MAYKKKTHYENLIVVATNNGSNLVEELIDSISIHNIKYQILIVDTKSDKEHYNKLQKLVAEKPNLLLTQTPERTFDTGAYIWAYLNYNSKIYHFMHDSITIKSSNFFQDISTFLSDEFDVVPYMWFKEYGMHFWGMYEHWNEFYKINGCLNEIEYGFFGPMFSCEKQTLDKLSLIGLTLPKTKQQQNAFERIWAILFEQNNLSVYKWHEFERSLAIADTYPHIHKKFFERL